jgi:hypothetical protein
MIPPGGLLDSLLPGATLELVVPPHSDAGGALACAFAPGEVAVFEEEEEDLVLLSRRRNAPFVRRRLEGRLSARSEREEEVVFERVGTGNCGCWVLFGEVAPPPPKKRLRASWRLDSAC